jgi:hypothetical protein
VYEREEKPVSDAKAKTIPEFCDANTISVPLFYKLKKQGLAPCVTEAGARRFITPESESAWRRAMTKPAGYLESLT